MPAITIGIAVCWISGATSRKKSRITGKASTRLARKVSPVSSRPPKYPAGRPSEMPIMNEIIAAKGAIRSTSRAPITAREKTSRARLSPPSR
jgi:hypothetical protein